MLKVQEIRELIKLVDHSNIDEFVYEYEGSKIKMKKNTAESVIVQPAKTSVEAVQTQQPVQTAAVIQEPAAAPAVQEPVKEVAANTKDLHKIVSPMVGTFYQSSSPDADSYVKVGYHLPVRVSDTQH